MGLDALLDALPIIEDISAPLLVRERAEITFRSGKKTLAYVVGKTAGEKLIYDCDAIKIAGRWYTKGTKYPNLSLVPLDIQRREICSKISIL